MSPGYLRLIRTPENPGSDRDAILITRPEPGASQTAMRVAEMGLRPIVAPLLAVRTLTARLPPVASIGAMVITSANAVSVISPDFHDLATYAVGDATAARATAAGFKRVASASGDAVALAALIKANRRPADGVLLLATGRRQGHPLAVSLRQAGFMVLRRVVYAAEPVRRLPDTASAALRKGTVRAALFFSSETAEHFVRMCQRDGLTVQVRGSEAVAISERTGMALNALPWQRIRVARSPNQNEMLALLR